MRKIILKIFKKPIPSFLLLGITTILFLYGTAIATESSIRKSNNTNTAESLIKASTYNKSDIDKDGTISLRDAIYALQVVSGTRPQNENVNCWLVAENGDPPDEATIFKLSLINVGGQNFFVVGKQENREGNFGGDIIHGSGVIVGSNLILSLSDSESNEEEMEVSTYHVTLSLDTLNGTYDEFWREYEKNSRQMRNGYASGTFTYTSCP